VTGEVHGYGFWDGWDPEDSPEPRWRSRLLTRRSRGPIGRTWGHSRAQMLRRLSSLSRRLGKLPRSEMRACLRGER
jgi:hypothetical protein